jgi:hypothetical protein
MADAREIYRAWLRELKEDYREFGQFRLDEINSYTDLDYHYGQFLTDIAMSLDESDVKDPLKWLDKAEKEIHKIKNKLIDKFDISFDEKEEQEFASDEPIPFTEGTSDEFNKAGAVRRKRLFPDLASLVDYIKDVPYPAGIQRVRDEHGKVLGYYLWVTK